MFELPAEILTEITTYVGELLGAYWILIGLAIGVPLSFYVIRKIISIVPGN